MTLIQWGFILVFGSLVLRLIWLIYRGAVPRRRGAIWLVLWSLGVMVVAKPELSTKLASWLGVARGADAISYVAIAFLSILIFRAFQLIEIQDRQISELTTALALKEWADGREMMLKDDA